MPRQVESGLIVRFLGVNPDIQQTFHIYGMFLSIVTKPILSFGAGCPKYTRKLDTVSQSKLQFAMTVASNNGIVKWNCHLGRGVVE